MTFTLLLSLVGCLAFGGLAMAGQRFPPPEFESGYQLPTTTTPVARAEALEYLDVGVLAAALGLATWLVLRKRSRRGVLALSIFSLAYFGFYREGCICAIGSVQNVALAMFDRGYIIPLGTLAFFILPLAVSLLAGRTFCAAVCPHGALQDLVLLKPVKLPAWLEQGLSVIPFLYLGAAILFAATGTTFIICRYDPFVPLFRLSGGLTMLLVGAGFLVTGMFVGRPYCRFLCPYGALLRLGGLLSKWRVRVTPDLCTQCRLCEESCPFGAMRKPHPNPPNPLALPGERKRFAGLLLLLPVLMAVGGWVGSKLSGPASTVHPTVALAGQYLRHQETPIQAGLQTPEALALKRAEQDPPAVLGAAADIRRRFLTGGWFFGAFLGLVVGVKLLGLSVRQKRTDYEPDRGACLACARCFRYCPSELQRLGLEALIPEGIPLAPEPNPPSNQPAQS